MTDKEARGMILEHAVPGAPPYVPVMERGPQDTAYTEMLRMQDLSTQQAAEIARLQELADSEGTRAVEYLRRSRKAEAEVEMLRDALRSLDFASGCLIGKPITEIETGLVLIARAARRALWPNDTVSRGQQQP